MNDDLNIGELKSEIERIKKKKDEMKVLLEIDKNKKRIDEIQKQLQDSAVWSDAKKMADLNREKSDLEETVHIFDSMETGIEDYGVLMELAGEGEAPLEEVEKVRKKVNALLKDMEFQRMLGGKMDKNNAILSINSGAGGRESQDWAVMLTRMYTRWAERRGFSVEILDKVSGDDASGIKGITMLISGRMAFGYLKSETGVHRLVRISPFDSNKRRHTSFCSVFATPEIDDSVDVEIDDGDLKVDTYRASGAGGQHVNTTDSAIRITHEPTGIVVQCQQERSQHKNRATAMKILRSKIYEHEMEKKRNQVKEQEEQKMGINFGSQIRSYVLHPYQMVKEHRIGFDTGKAEAVLNGDEILDTIMEKVLLDMGGEF